MGFEARSDGNSASSSCVQLGGHLRSPALTGAAVQHLLAKIQSRKSKFEHSNSIREALTELLVGLTKQFEGE